MYLSATYFLLSITFERFIILVHLALVYFMIPPSNVFLSLFLSRSRYVPEAGLELLGSRDLPALVSLVLGLQEHATMPRAQNVF